MKYEIKILKSDTEPHEVVVENFKLYQNRHGSWCYSFSTPNNKRLIEGSYSANELCFFTEWDSSIRVILVPETSDNSGYVYCVNHLRWEFEVIRIAQEDFLPI